MSRIPIKGHDKNGAALVENSSVVRYCDTEWMYHGAYYSTKRDTINMFLTSVKTDKSIVLNNRDLNYDGIVLVRNENTE